ncbi:hypothetical protein VKT23_004631 [Stygiomarasmius scandens]|uniref:Uncharacterized protein n=1 Tax=Marasmiellus scandens TaxID=2682957 RepID=A0ABR1JW72_9AGAR
MPKIIIRGGAQKTQTAATGRKGVRVRKTNTAATACPRVRTKRQPWDARKSTGGEAPRLTIGGGDSDEDEDENISLGLVNNAAGSDSLAVGVEAVPDQNDESMAEATGMVLDYTDDFARLSPDVQWCVGCGDFTTHTRKAKCNTCGQIVCFAGPGSKACLEVSQSYAEKGMLQGHRFTCPGCAKKDHWMKKTDGYVTYSGFSDKHGKQLDVIRNIRSCDFTFFKAPTMPTLGLLQIELDEEMLEVRTPYDVTKRLAQGFASGLVSAHDIIKHGLRAPDIPTNNAASPRPLVAQVIKFNFLTTQSKTRYVNQIHQIMGAFRSMGVDQIVIFLATHGDPERGDLHFAPHGRGAHQLEAVGYLLALESEI